jgi:hypothetical protein
MFFIRIRFGSLALICFLELNALSQYSAFRPNEFKKAIIFFNQKKVEFKRCSSNTGLNLKQAFAIVAPEISEYSSFNNYLEINTLKVLYVQKGTGYSNFSVGYFQMKPSFVENLEKTIKNEPLLYSKFKDYLIELKDPKEQRRERVKRLDNEKWQFKYLRLFLILVNNRTKNIDFLNEEEQLKYFSTSYNAGFSKSKQDLLKEMEKERFPNYFEKKFNYSTVSLEFYEALKN